MKILCFVLAWSLSAAAANRRPLLCVEDVVPSVNSHYYTSALSDMQNYPDPNSTQFEYAWIYIQATHGHKEKVDRIYQAAEFYGVPPTVLVGAILQESGFMDLGLASDFGNWACGDMQINVQDWCSWAQGADSKMQKRIQWPNETIADFVKGHPGVDICDVSFMVPEHAQPFYDIGIQRMGKRQPLNPPYMLTGFDILYPRQIVYSQVQAAFLQVTYNNESSDDPTINPDLDDDPAQYLRFLMGRSFANHCADHNFGIPAGASTLVDIFNSLPQEIQSAQKIGPGENPGPGCAHQIKQIYKPIAVGWLLADAIYNAGPELLPGILIYQKKSGIAWENFTSDDLINAIDFSISQPDSGISDIGLQEAKDHIRGVINAVTTN